jgi:hypothetical protein
MKVGDLVRVIDFYGIGGGGQLGVVVDIGWTGNHIWVVMDGAKKLWPRHLLEAVS